MTHLALLDGNAGSDSAERTAGRQKLVALCDQGKFRQITENLLPVLIHPDRVAEAEFVAAIFDMADEVGPQGFKDQQAALMSRIDSVADLPRIKCPTLVLVGRQDILTPPEMSQQMHEGIAGSKLTFIEDCGHLSTMERPEAVNDALRIWLG